MTASNRIVTPFDILDPAAFRVKFEAINGQTFDTFSALSPEREQAQIEAKVGDPTIFAKKGLLDPKWTPDDLAAACGMDTSP